MGATLLLTDRLARYRAFRPRASYAMALSFDPNPRADLEALLRQVLDAHAEATAVLRQYTGELAASPSSAARAQRLVQAWSNDYGAQILALNAADPNAPVPSGMTLEMSQDDAQALVRGLWADATLGLGLYQNGRIFRAIDQGDWDANDARRDLQHKLDVCRLLLGLHEDGSLARTFGAGGSGVAGLGALGLTWVGVAIVVAIIAAVAAVLISLGQSLFESYQRWQRFDALCAQAKEDGDHDTVEQCRSTVSAIPKPPDYGTTAILAGAAVLTVYLLATFTLPKLLASRKGS